MKTESGKTQLVVLRHTPYGNSFARAGLDVALAAAAFDQAVSVLFLGDGVLQLLPTQDSSAIESKNIGKIIASLPLYDIETLYVDADALVQFSVVPDELPSGSKLLDAAGISLLMARHDHVLGF